MGLTAIISNNQQGRIRFRLLDKKGDKAYFESLGNELNRINGIYSVKTNPITGSVLVLHNTNTESIIQQIKDAGFFFVKDTNHKEDPVTESVRKSYAFLDNTIKNYVGGLSIHSLVLALLIVTGFYQILRGNLGLPAWYVAFWYAMTLAKR